jgi:hypothetical protein
MWVRPLGRLRIGRPVLVPAAGKPAGLGTPWSNLAAIDALGCALTDAFLVFTMPAA